MPSTQPESIRQIADSFELLWNAAQGADQAPELKRHLPPAGDTLHLPVLAALVGIDLRNRWRVGNPCFLEDYLERFPELKIVSERLPYLIAAEYQARQMYGDQPPVEVFRTRFPNECRAAESLIRGESLRTL